MYKDVENKGTYNKNIYTVPNLTCSKNIIFFYLFISF